MALAIPLVGTILSLSLDIYSTTRQLVNGILSPSSFFPFERILFGILSLVVYYGLYRYKKWALYPGIILMLSSSIVVLLQPSLEGVVKIIVIGINAFYLWLIYINRKAFSK